MTSLFLGITDPQEALELKTVALHELKANAAAGVITRGEADVLVVELLEDYYQWCQEQNN